MLNRGMRGILPHCGKVDAESELCSINKKEIRSRKPSAPVQVSDYLGMNPVSWDLQVQLSDYLPLRQLYEGFQ